MIAASNNHWEHFEHEADIGIRGIGRTPDQAFEQAALALTAVSIPIADVHPRQSIAIHGKAASLEMLFADWLNALIYEMATRLMLFHRFEVKISHCRLRAQAWGEIMDPVRHHPSVEIKAATYAELKVMRLKNGLWLAQCILDV